MQISNTLSNFIGYISHFMGHGATETKNVIESPVQNLENKPITDFMITNATVKQEVVLKPDVFIQQLKSGELENTSSKIIVAGDVVLSSDNLVTELPDDLEIKGDLLVKHCENLVKFPKNLIAKSLKVHDCPKIITLAENISIKQKITVAECDELIKFSSENIILSLSESLIIEDCKKLESIPNFSKIGENLELSNCPLLVDVPETANIFGNIEITNCPKITIIPISWSSELVVKQQSPSPKVNLSNTGVSFKQIEQYNKNYKTSVKIMLGVSIEQEHPFNNNLKEALFYWSQFTDETKEIPEITVNFQQEQDLCKLLFVLANLTNSECYKWDVDNMSLKIPHLLNTATEECKTRAFEYLNKEINFYYLKPKHHFCTFKSILSKFIDILNK